MTIAGSPKKLGQDIADGYFMPTPPLLKLYTVADINTIISAINIVARDLRQEQILLDDIMTLKTRNMKLSRLNQALVVIQSYCKKKRIHL